MSFPENSRLFACWRNPKGGAESYVLATHAAPVQQTFYFTNPSFTDEGRFLWLRCGFPPPGGSYSSQCLGVVDFERDELRVYPETGFSTAAPVVDRATGEVYWGNRLEIWKRGPLERDRPVRVNTFPQSLVAGRVERIATHLGFSADKRALGIDARFIDDSGRQTVVLGDLPLDGSPFRLWQRFEGLFHDHGLFSPTDPDVLLFAHEYWQDHIAEPFDGSLPYHRLWLIRRGEKARPVLKEPVSHSGHEWWDPDGLHLWYVHYGVGVKKVEIATGEETLVWPGHLAHAYSDRSGRYLVADAMDDPGNPDCRVVFRDTVTGRELGLVDSPPLPPGATKCVHLHPHPQFCFGDRYVCYTTTALGRVDVALASVRDLIARTA